VTEYVEENGNRVTVKKIDINEMFMQGSKNQTFYS